MKRSVVLVSDSSSADQVSICEAAALHSGLLERVLRYPGFREARQGVVWLPLGPETLQRLGAFLEREEQENSGAKARRTEFNFEIGCEELLELLSAAYYTETWPLHSLCSRMLLSLLSQASCLSLEGLSEHALQLLCRAATLPQLCLLQDLSLMPTALTDAEWLSRSPVALPACLVGAWEEHRGGGARCDYESLQLWLHGAEAPGRAFATRCLLSGDCSLAGLTRLSLVSCVDAAMLPLLSELPSLRQLVIRLEQRPPKSLLLPAAVCVRLTHLEVCNALLSKHTPSMLRLRVFLLRCSLSFPKKLRLDFLPPSLESLSLCDSLLAATELCLPPECLASLSSLSLPCSRVAAVRMGRELMPHGGAALSALGLAARLSSLDLSGCNIHDDVAFRRCLELVLPPLLHLNLCDNKLQAPSFAVIAAGGGSLRTLLLAGNRLGASLSLEATCSMPHLSLLDVSQNCIPPPTAQLFVAACLARLPSLSELCVARQSLWTRQYVALRDQFRGTAARFDPIDLESEDQIVPPDQDGMQM